MLSSLPTFAYDEIKLIVGDAKPGQPFCGFFVTELLLTTVVPRTEEALKLAELSTFIRKNRIVYVLGLTQDYLGNRPQVLGIAYLDPISGEIILQEYQPDTISSISYDTTFTNDKQASTWIMGKIVADVELRNCETYSDMQNILNDDGALWELDEYNCGAMYSIFRSRYELRIPKEECLIILRHELATFGA